MEITACSGRWRSAGGSFELSDAGLRARLLNGLNGGDTFFANANDRRRLAAIGALKRRNMEAKLGRSLKLEP